LGADEAEMGKSGTKSIQQRGRATFKTAGLSLKIKPEVKDLHNFKNKMLSGVWWCVPVIPALKK
jgi:hypothetical protein